MRDYHRNYICQLAGFGKKKSKNQNSRKDLECKCFVPIIRRHLDDCPLVKKPCPLHGCCGGREKKIDINSDKSTFISIHPSLKSEGIFLPLQDLVRNCSKEDGKFNFSYYSPREYRKVKNCKVQTNSIEFQTSSTNYIVEKTKSFMSDKSRMKKLKQCFYLPNNSVSARKAHSQISITENNISNSSRKEIKTRDVSVSASIERFCRSKKNVDDCFGPFNWYCCNKIDSSDGERSSEKGGLNSDLLTVTQQLKEGNLINHKIFEIRRNKGLNEYPLLKSKKNIMRFSPQVYFSTVEDFEQKSKDVPSSDSQKKREFSDKQYCFYENEGNSDKANDKGPRKSWGNLSNSTKSQTDSTASIYYTPIILMPADLSESERSDFEKKNKGIQNDDRQAEKKQINSSSSNHSQNSSNHSLTFKNSAKSEKIIINEEMDRRTSVMESKPYMEKVHCETERNSYQTESRSLCVGNKTSYMENKYYHIENKPSRMESKTSYVEHKPSYMESKSSYVEHKPSYVENKTSYVEHKPSYMESKSSYVEHKPSYMESKSSYVEHKPSYVENKTSYVEHKPSYMESKSSYVEHKPSYVENKTSYVEHKPSYTESKTSCIESKPSYAENRSPGVEKVASQGERKYYHNEKIPSYVEKRASQKERKPCHMEKRSSHMGKVTSQMESNPYSADNKYSSVEKLSSRTEKKPYQEEIKSHMEKKYQMDSMVGKKNSHMSKTQFKENVTETESSLMHRKFETDDKESFNGNEKDIKSQSYIMETDKATMTSFEDWPCPSGPSYKPRFPGDKKLALCCSCGNEQVNDNEPPKTLINRKSISCQTSQYVINSHQKTYEKREGEPDQYQLRSNISEEIIDTQYDKSLMAVPSFSVKATQTSPSLKDEDVIISVSNKTFVKKSFTSKESDLAIEKLAQKGWTKSYSDGEILDKQKCDCSGEYALARPCRCSPPESKYNQEHTPYLKTVKADNACEEENKHSTQSKEKNAKKSSAVSDNGSCSDLSELYKIIDSQFKNVNENSESTNTNVLNQCAVEHCDKALNTEICGLLSDTFDQFLKYKKEIKGKKFVDCGVQTGSPITFCKCPPKTGSLDWRADSKKKELFVCKLCSRKMDTVMLDKNTMTYNEIKVEKVKKTGNESSVSKYSDWNCPSNSNSSKSKNSNKSQNCTFVASKPPRKKKKENSKSPDKNSNLGGITKLCNSKLSGSSSKSNLDILLKSEEKNSKIVPSNLNSSKPSKTEQTQKKGNWRCDSYESTKKSTTKYSFPVTVKQNWPIDIMRNLQQTNNNLNKKDKDIFTEFCKQKRIFESEPSDEGPFEKKLKNESFGGINIFNFCHGGNQQNSFALDSPSKFKLILKTHSLPNQRKHIGTLKKDSGFVWKPKTSRPQISLEGILPTKNNLKFVKSEDKFITKNINQKLSENASYPFQNNSHSTWLEDERSIQNLYKCSQCKSLTFISKRNSYQDELIEFELKQLRKNFMNDLEIVECKSEKLTNSSTQNVSSEHLIENSHSSTENIYYSDETEGHQQSEEYQNND